MPTLFKSRLRKLPTGGSQQCRLTVSSLPSTFCHNTDSIGNDSTLVLAKWHDSHTAVSHLGFCISLLTSLQPLPCSYSLCCNRSVRMYVRSGYSSAQKPPWLPISLTARGKKIFKNGPQCPTGANSPLASLPALLLLSA